MTEAAISAMLATLHDEGHTRYLTAEESQAQTESLSGEYVGVGIQVEQRTEGIVVVAPIDGSPAMEAGVRPGDILVSVDGQDVSTRTVDDVVKIIRGPEGSKITLEFRRAGEANPLSFTLTRRKIEVSPVAWVMLDDHIALIRLSQFSTGAGDDIIKALDAAKKQGAERVVLDLRNNPGGYVNEAIKVASTFVPEGSTIFVSQFRDGSRQEHKAEPQAANIGDLPLIVLINQGSASSSEITAGAIRANTPNATLIGERTFGTGTVLSTFELDNGGTILLGTELWLTPDGRMIRDHGIRPDVQVGLRDGQYPFIPVNNAGPLPDNLNDFQLEWAIDVLRNTSATTP
jgi:carboxyl-terminal processing protease